MKHLPLPQATDVLNLCALARNTKLASYPALAAALRDILRAYCAYRRVDGNPKALDAPVALPLEETLQTSLRNHYSSPPDSIEPFLTSIRKNGSPDVCPMCGSPKSGTLDHVFPKDLFPEFAVFSLNLVPACDCNTKRGADYIGPAVGERVLHPYFDNVLAYRLVRALIEPDQDHGYTRPRISIELITQPQDAAFQAVNFHVVNVLARTDLRSHFDATWPKFWNRPEDYFGLPAGALTEAAFLQAVRDALARQDRHFGTPNNWDSMLLAGLEANMGAIRALMQRTTDLRINPNA